MRKTFSKATLVIAMAAFLGLGACAVIPYSSASSPQELGYDQGWEDAQRGGQSKTAAEDGRYELESNIMDFRRGYSQGWADYMKRLRGEDSGGNGGD